MSPLPALPPRRRLPAGRRRVAVLLLLLIGPLAAAAAAAPPARPGADAPPQWLPITAQACLSNGTCIALEVPRGDRQLAWGLQMRPPLPPLRGMWFGYPEPTSLRFWMHRTPEPLDMLFIREGRVMAIEARRPPCMRLPCRSYGPDEAVDGVLELAAGEAERLQIRVGSPLRITPLAPPRRLGGPAAPAPG